MSNTATTIDNSYYNRSRWHATNLVDNDGVRLEIRPNGSSNRRALLICVGLLAFVNGSVGSVFFALGAWPVLPFAGLEALLLAGAALAILRAERVELLTISNRCVHLTVCRGKRRIVRTFTRYWTQVKWEPGRTKNERSRLFLISRGRAQEIGCELIESKKYDLHQQLTEILNR